MPSPLRDERRCGALWNPRTTSLYRGAERDSSAVLLGLAKGLGRRKRRDGRAVRPGRLGGESSSVADQGATPIDRTLIGV